MFVLHPDPIRAVWTRSLLAGISHHLVLLAFCSQGHPSDKRILSELAPAAVDQFWHIRSPCRHHKCMFEAVTFGKCWFSMGFGSHLVRQLGTEKALSPLLWSRRLPFPCHSHRAHLFLFYYNFSVGRNPGEFCSPRVMWSVNCYTCLE